MKNIKNNENKKLKYQFIFVPLHTNISLRREYA